MGFSTGGQIVYGLEFLEVYPDYKCRNDSISNHNTLPFHQTIKANHDIDFDYQVDQVDQSQSNWFECDRDYICDNNLSPEEWVIDYESPNSYHNWVDPGKLNLTCVDKRLIGSLGSVYFLGFAVSAGVTPYLSDQYGRKYPYFFSIFFQTISYALIILSKNIYLTIGCYLIVGLCAGGRVAIGTIYISEFLPKKYWALAITMKNVFDSSIMIVQSIYYSFCKNWIYLHLLGLSIAIVIVICLYFLLPESPKYYYSKGQFDKCREILVVIAKANGGDVKAIKNIVFDTEFEQSNLN